MSLLCIAALRECRILTGLGSCQGDRNCFCHPFALLLCHGLSFCLSEAGGMGWRALASPVDPWARADAQLLGPDIVF